MEADVRASLIFLGVQVAGVSLTATLLALLAWETRREFVRWWAGAWMALAVSFGSLLLWSLVGGGHTLWLAPFLVGGYVFALFVARGFVAFGRRQWRASAWLATGAGAWCVGLLAFGGQSADAILRLHGVAWGVLLVLAFAQARRIEAPGAHRTGRRVALASLCALIVDLVGLGLLARLDLRALAPLRTLVPYHALLDLLLLTGLGFGQVMLVMETVSAELAESNRELGAARDRLEILAKVDPLTNALNRHAFHALFAERANGDTDRSGCVVVIDIDNLKRLNDTRGHAAGDQAIRAAAATIRHMIRADDLLFRWGGDEFLAVLFGVTKEAAGARLRTLSEGNSREGAAPQLSWGVSSFDGLSRLGEAIEAADRAMYDGRTRRRDGA